jgi:hypothetical protein
MLGRKDKKNKFHLPVTEEPKVPNKLGNVMGEEMSTEEPDSGEDSTGEEAPLDGLAAAGPGNSASRYRLVIVPDREPDTPQRTWEAYYRNRDFAGAVGDPLLTVVEADSQLEAEYKASHLQHGETSDIIAVSTNNPVSNAAAESNFSFPKKMPPRAEKPRPRIFRSK